MKVSHLQNCPTHYNFESDWQNAASQSSLHKDTQWSGNSTCHACPYQVTKLCHIHPNLYFPLVPVLAETYSLWKNIHYQLWTAKKKVIDFQKHFKRDKITWSKFAMISNKSKRQFFFFHSDDPCPHSVVESVITLRSLI